jgi:hypothetical protein
MHLHPRPREIAACAEFPNDNPALHRGALWCCVEIRGEPVCERAVTESPRAEGVEQVEPTPTEPTVLAHSETADELVAQIAMLVEEVAAIVEPVADAEDDVGEPGEDTTATEDEEYEEIVVVDDLAFDDAVVEEAPSEAAPAPEDASSSDPFAVLLGILEEVARGAGCQKDMLVCLRVALGAARVDETTLPRVCVDTLLAAGMLEENEHGLVRAGAFARQVVAWQGVLRGDSEDFGACGGTMLDEWCASLLAKIVGSSARVEGFRRDLRGRGVAAFGLVADAA